MVAAVFVLTVVSHSGVLKLPFFFPLLSKVKNSLISGKSIEVVSPNVNCDDLWIRKNWDDFQFCFVGLGDWGKGFLFILF